MKKDAWADLLVKLAISFREAIEVLNRTGRKILLVSDNERRLLGVLSDADLRRAMLQGAGLSDSIEPYVIYDPIVINQRASDEEVSAVMRETGVYQVPLVDGQGRICGLRRIEEFLPNAPRGNRVIVMAGGLGTRLLPLTEKLPKPLVPIHGRPLLSILLDSLLGAGFRDIQVAVNYKSEMIKDEVRRSERYDSVEFIEEEERMGTAGALSLIGERPEQPLLVVNGDILTQLDYGAFLDFHCQGRHQLTAAVRQEKFVIPYGVVELEGNRVTQLTEKPEQIYFANAGAYVIEPRLLDLIPIGRAFDMTSLIELCLADGLSVGGFPIHEYWQDIGRPDDLQQAKADYLEFFEMPL